MHPWKRLFFSWVFLEIKGTGKEFTVESSRTHLSFLILKFEGIDSIAQASELVGAKILVPQECLQELEDDSFYAYQLVGCVVWREDGRLVGEVTDILSAGANECLVVGKGKKERLIPLTKEICRTIDPDKKTIVIDPPDGLLEIDEI
ncbi:MAG: ribosome maturation factor RimM [Acidobacteria bacterium]|nr:ribosome maturation factor RimM [Acidobacteriota bacterium]MCG2817043.1 ribosome maturation factor RimM [Candidatus Aminicenantes bacterium]MBU2439024.1 ribosome maturation factor RimM [Acidobacteriota bacterium]MBU4203855.1 ribosome maturation factor RimM [Acidobacteriota bacterium]MBU4255107.1 ribosome maturation factor RimM [Acidobacteriota bacterium]